MNKRRYASTDFYFHINKALFLLNNELEDILEWEAAQKEQEELSWERGEIYD